MLVVWTPSLSDRWWPTAVAAGLVQSVDHQLHDGLVDTQCAHQVRVLEEHLVVHGTTVGKKE